MIEVQDKTMTVDNEMILEKYIELHEMYRHTDKANTIREAEKLIYYEKYDQAWIKLKDLPDRDQLLDKLSKTLENKSVYGTLSKIIKGKCDSKFEEMKGYTSLATHIIIEMEKGNSEYLPLLKSVWRYVGDMMYSTTYKKEI